MSNEKTGNAAGASRAQDEIVSNAGAALISQPAAANK